MNDVARADVLVTAIRDYASAAVQASWAGSKTPSEAIEIRNNLREAIRTLTYAIATSFNKPSGEDMVVRDLVAMEKYFEDH